MSDTLSRAIGAGNVVGTLTVSMLAHSDVYYKIDYMVDGVYRTYEGSDMRCLDGDPRTAMSSLCGFLAAEGERRDGALFNESVAEWAHLVDDELCCLQEELNYSATD